MSAKLLLVSGYSGAGKSLLVGAAVDSLTGIAYLQAVVTRPRRPDEVGSFEHEFVSDAEYETRRAAATHWDHVEYQGYKYGVDIDWVFKMLASGTNLICAIAPETGIYMKLKKLYGKEPLSIWIDTPQAVSSERIKNDHLRSSRQESGELRSMLQKSFTPSGDKSQDAHQFTELVQQLLDD